jgi:hypothetical protein
MTLSLNGAEWQAPDANASIFDNGYAAMLKRIGE